MLSPLVLAALVSALHILSVALALGAIALRARALSREDLPSALQADNAWGISALLLWATGLARAFGGLEKGAAFYMDSPAFWIKMGLLLLVTLLEVWPMITLIRWRIRPALQNPTDMRLIARLSRIQLGLVVLMPFAAAAMARGLLR